MGLYDRDYATEREPGYHFNAPQSITTQLVLVTVAVYVLQMFAGPQFTDRLELTADWYRAPWNVYRLLTYGFLHDPGSMLHIVFNMFGLYTFGKPVEETYGRATFGWFYLTAIVFSGLVWSLSEMAAPGGGGAAVGASGGVVAVVILFALNFPHAKGMVFPIPFPIPMWVLATGIVLMDFSGAITRAGGVAFTAHLGGALFGWIFYQTGWTPQRLFNKLGGGPRSRKPKLRVVDHEEEVESATEQELDRILQKIQAEGQDSLSWSERRTLERASREYQNRRK
jgi:membrane associated rhomboid family serine protease